MVGGVGPLSGAAGALADPAALRPRRQARIVRAFLCGLNLTTAVAEYGRLAAGELRFDQRAPCDLDEDRSAQLHFGTFRDGFADVVRVFWTTLRTSAERSGFLADERRGRAWSWNNRLGLAVCVLHCKHLGLGHTQGINLALSGQVRNPTQTSRQRSLRRTKVPFKSS